VKPFARLIFFASVTAFASLLPAAEQDVAELIGVEFFAAGGVGFVGTISPGERTFKKIYAEKNNLEQFVLVYGRGNNAARMYALVAFYRLNRPLYEHLKAQYRGSTIAVATMAGCIRDEDGVGDMITRLERGDFDSLFPATPKTSG
jgi:hypothetical protein